MYLDLVQMCSYRAQGNDTNSKHSLLIIKDFLDTGGCLGGAWGVLSGQVYAEVLSGKEILYMIFVTWWVLPVILGPSGAPHGIESRD